jgi:membrane protease YdiL (CAAX protease family)
MVHSNNNFDQHLWGRPKRQLDSEGGALILPRFQAKLANIKKCTVQTPETTSIHPKTNVCPPIIMWILNLESRCRLKCTVNSSPNKQLQRLPQAAIPLAYNYVIKSQRRRFPLACQAFSENNGSDNDDTIDVIIISSTPTNFQAINSDIVEDDAWSICKTLTQLWAIVLPIGYAGVPLAGQALSQHPGGPSFAAFGGEALAITAVVLFLRHKDFKLRISLNIKSMGIGFAAGVAALIVNQILFSTTGGGSGDGGTSTATTTSDVAGVLLSNSSSPAATMALFTASALLAPATEEIIYRGFFLGSLTRLGISPIVAVGASAVAFSAAHLQPDAFLQLTFVGICLGSAAVVSKGNVLAPFVGHATYNTALLLSLLSSPSLKILEN